MKASHLALFATVGALIAASTDEIRERCSEVTLQKFKAAESEINDALKEGVTEDLTAGAGVVIDMDAVKSGFEGMAERLEERIGVYLGGVVDESIRKVHAEFMAGQAAEAAAG